MSYDLDAPIPERGWPGPIPRVPAAACRALRSAAHVAVRGWLRAYHRLTIAGAEHLPAAGPFVLVANHASHLDALCLMAAVPFGRRHRTFAAAAADYFVDGLLRLAASAFVVNALPLDRRPGCGGGLARCRRLLARGDNGLILFPEGTRSVTGAMGPFRPGIGLLVAGTSVPVLPCHLGGTRDALPKGRWIPRPRRLRLTIGPPRRYTDAGRDRAPRAGDLRRPAGRGAVARAVTQGRGGGMTGSPAQPASAPAAMHRWYNGMALPVLPDRSPAGSAAATLSFKASYGKRPAAR